MLARASILTLALACFAQQAAAAQPELTFDMSYYFYEEPDFMNDESNPAFVSVGIRDWDVVADPKSPWHFLYTAEATRGWVDYSSKSTGRGDKNYYKLRGEYYAGYNMGQLTPIIGLGYRWLYDDSGGMVTTTGAAGYDRRSQYFYVPVGGIFSLSDSVRVKGQFNYLVAGLQSSFLSDIAGYSDVDNEQKKGWGGDATVDFKVNDRVSVYSFYRYWRIGKSETAVGNYAGVPTFLAWEPANITTEFGLGVAYAF